MPHTIPFTKGHGTGNDFVIIADPDGELALSDDQVAVLCDRRFGIGADGTLRVVRSAALPEWADAADAEWFMDYRNADGSAAEMCGNGIRVYARYLLETGLASLSEGEALRIGTRAGTKSVTRSDLGFEVDLGVFGVDESDVLVRAKELGPARPGIGVDVGNPHVVVALPSADDLEAIDLTAQPLLEPAPPNGANVEFVVPAPLRQAPTSHAAGQDATENVGEIRMRVFERGVGETLSCGTGVAAAAIAVRHWAGPGAPDRWRVEVPGGVLGVRMTEGHVLLSGPATLVYSGQVSLA